MDDPVPMSAQTPTAYTIINGWWLDIGEGSYAHKFLKEGAITGSYNDVIRLLKLEASGWANLSSGNIGETVQYNAGGDGSTGTCIGYDNDLRYIWIRMDDSGDTFSDTSNALKVGTTVTSDIIDTNGSLSGDELFANVYTLGTIADDPYAQVYIFQNGSRVSEWSSYDNWDRGQIDIVLQVKEMGVEIDGAVITVFARQSGDLFDNFEIDLTNGGRNAVPLSTATDINNTTGEWYILYDGASGNFTVGEVIEADDGSWYAEVVANTEDYGTAGVLLVTGLNGSLTDNDAFTGATSGTTADVNGTEGDTYFEWSSGTDFSTLGQIVTGGTSGAKRILRGVDGTNDVAVLQVDHSHVSVSGSDRNAYYKDFSSGETVTGASDGSVVLASDSSTVVSGFSDVSILFVNGTVPTGGTTGTFTIGERITWASGEAFVLKDASNVLTLANVTEPTLISGNQVTGDISSATATPTENLSFKTKINKNFSQQTAYPYSVIIEGGSLYEAGRSLSEIYEYLKYACTDGNTDIRYTCESGAIGSGYITQLEGQEYISAQSGYAVTKTSPFGTFAGGTFFGAQGVWLEGMAAADANNIQLTDADGTVRTPYQSVTVKVQSIQSGDRILVTRASGTAITKDIYVSDATANVAGDNDFVVSGDIEIDTPGSGAIRIYEATSSIEYRIRYSTWSGNQFDFISEISGSCTSGASGNILYDSAATFTSENIEYGDMVRNTTDGSYGYVVSVDTANKITTTSLTQGSSNAWFSGNNYSFHTLQTNHDENDTAYVPFLDRRANATSEEISVLFASNRNVLIRVRVKGIIPFETTGTVDNTGLTATAIRTEDSIVT